MNEDLTTTHLERATLGAGYALRREDDALELVNPSLQVMTAGWATVEQWWLRMRSRVVLPAATQCPVCGLVQLLGVVEGGVTEPVGGDGVAGRERLFELVFTGHPHGLDREASAGEGSRGSLMLVREVTVVRAKLQAMEESIRQYESLCEAIQDVYYRTDIEGRILFVSPSCGKMIAYSAAELVGHSLVDLCIDPDYWTELMDLLGQHGSINDFQLVLQCKKGNQVPVVMNARIIADEHGRQVAVEGIMRDMTEREHLDRMLAEQTRRLQATMAELEHQKFALDQHAMVAVADSEGIILTANKLLVAVGQYALSELKGSNHRIFNSGFHPKSFFKEMWRTITNGRVWRGELRNRRKDGSFFWVSCTIVPFMTPAGKPYQYVAISTDISERMEAERRAEEGRRFLLNAADAMGDGVYVLDMQGHLTFMNREASRLLGWREEELLGKNFHQAIHFQRADRTPFPVADCPVHRSLLGRSFRVEEDCFTRKDGTLMSVSYMTAPFQEEGHIKGSVAVFQEVGQRLKLEQELRQERDAARESSRLKSEFLANMSHEIRTPMNAIVGMNDLLMNTRLDGEQEDFARTIQESAESLLALINDILDFSKIEAGRIDLEVIDFSPVVVVEGVAELLTSQAHEKGVALTTFIAPAIPRQLRGDPGRLRQMLLNLIGNAIKFTDEGWAEVRAELVGESGGQVIIRVEVKDSGIGLSQSARQRLFQPFTQGDGSTNRRYGGTGLGLAISKRLAELMGGEIGAESEEGQGSTFWFRLPFWRSDAQLEEGEELPIATLAGKVAAVMVESGSDREAVVAYWHSWGMQCRVYAWLSDPVERTRMARGWLQEDRPPEVILFSAQLADLASAGHLLALKEEGWLQGKVAIALLDVSDREWEEQALREGYSSCLTKPVRQSEWVGAILEGVDPDLARSLREPVLSPREVVPVGAAPDMYDALESGKLLLLAEDNPVNQKVAMMQLKKMGYAVNAVANGQEAVEAASHLPYALILMDCQMPVMDGFEATHAIRRQESATARHTPIIAMTANAMKGDRERCLKAGMDDYLSKPVSPEELKRRLEYWIPKNVGELPPIEISQLYQLFGNDDEMVRDLLHHFLPSARELLERLRAAIQERRAEELIELTLELKGACANVGASSMAQMAKRLERLSLESPAMPWEDATQVMAGLDGAYSRVEAFVNRF